MNKNHSIPNVLAFVNLNDMVNCHDLFITLTGKGITDDGKIISLRRVGRVINDIEHIDLCLWFGKEGLQNILWLQGREEHKMLLKNLFKL